MRSWLNNSFFFLVVFLTIFTLNSSCQQKRTTILFLAGSGMKVPVSEIAANFKKETGIEVQTRFDGSAILRDYILDFKAGDIFMPGDKKNLDILSERGLVERSSFIAWHKVAILVSPEAKGRIKGLDDLAKDEIRLVISNPKFASLGRIVNENIINKHPRGSDILRNIIIYGSSSQDVLRLYRERKADAVIEWDVMAATPEGEGLVVIPLPEPYKVKDQLFVSLLTTARNPAVSKKFYDYITTKGKAVFHKYGYDVNGL